MAAYAMAGCEKPHIYIKAENLQDGKARFDIWTENGKEQMAVADETLAAGATLSLASLRVNLEKISGVSCTAREGGVAFILDIASFNDAKLFNDKNSTAQPGVENELKKILEL